MPVNLQIDLLEHPEVAEQLRAAVLDALRQPEFMQTLMALPEYRQLFKESIKEAVTPEKVWLSYEQVQVFLTMPRSTFYEWKTRHKKVLEISYSLATREPRIKLSSVLAAMETSRLVTATPMLPGIAPAKPNKPAAATTTAAAAPRTRLPAAALREVSFSPRR